MRPTWVIEAGVFGTDVDPLLVEIRRQGMVAESLPLAAINEGSPPVIGERVLGRGACVVAYGTLPFIRQVQLHQGWIPGAWCTQEDFDCTTYFPFFGKYLLNQNYVILNGAEAIRQADWLF